MSQYWLERGFPLQSIADPLRSSVQRHRPLPTFSAKMRLALLLFAAAGLRPPEIAAQPEPPRPAPVANQRFVRLPSGRRIRLLPPEQIAQIPETPELKASLAEFRRKLLYVIPARTDLRRFQTPVKNQDGWGMCFTFAFTGAIEATYKARCLQNPLLAATEPYCAGYTNSTPAQELDLSEWYLQHRISSQMSTHNPSAQHENECFACPCSPPCDTALNIDWNSDARYNLFVLTTVTGLRIAEERDAPLYDWDQPELLRIEAEDAAAGVVPDPAVFPAPDALCGPSGQPLQQRYDNYNYDSLIIASRADYNAVYGVKSLQVLPVSDLRNPQSLELYVANGHSVVIGLSFGGLTCPTTLNDGAAQCTFNPSLPAGSSFADGAGHYMLLVGYDRPAQRFLLKNSWGVDYYPYLSVPYGFLSATASSGYIVLDVPSARAQDVTHAQAYLGSWHVFRQDGSYRGKVTIHRVRDTPDDVLLFFPPIAAELPSLRRLARVGTYYPNDNGIYGQPHELTGLLNTANRLELTAGTFTGFGGDALGTQYSGGERWGAVWLDAADRAHDDSSQTYVRDFYNRAMHNWSGTWNLSTDGGAKYTLGITKVDPIPTRDGQFRFTGTLSALVTMNVAGVIDSGGTHAWFEFDQLSIWPGWGYHGRMDAYYDRQFRDGKLHEMILRTSSIVTDGHGGHASIWGEKAACTEGCSAGQAACAGSCQHTQTECVTRCRTACSSDCRARAEQARQACLGGCQTTAANCVKYAGGDPHQKAACIKEGQLCTQGCAQSFQSSAASCTSTCASPQPCSAACYAQSNACLANCTQLTGGCRASCSP